MILMDLRATPLQRRCRVGVQLCDGVPETREAGLATKDVSRHADRPGSQRRRCDRRCDRVLPGRRVHLAATLPVLLTVKVELVADS